MRMPRVNIYLPDDLADEAKRAGLNISKLTQGAIRSALAENSLHAWQSRVAKLTSPGVDHDSVLAAVHAAKEELEGG